MVARQLLVLAHSRTGSTAQLRDAVLDGVAEAGGDVAVVSLDVVDAGVEHVLAADGLVLCSPARFGALAGLAKDFFERIYPWFDEVPDVHPGLPYALVVKGASDADGAVRDVTRIATGLRWREVVAPTVCVGDLTAGHLAAAREAGAEIRTEAPVSTILVRNGRAVGVALENGDELHADVVASSVDPRRTFMQMVGERELPAEFVESVKRYKFRGSSGKVNLALDALPEFTCMPGEGPHLRGAISISPSVEYMERAYDDAKYGRFSRRPYVDIVIPSLTDPSVAPPGKHVMSCFVQYAPYHLEEGTWDDQREAFGDAVIAAIAEFAPSLPNIIRHRQVLTPLDLEREWGLSEGNIFQGELSLEQLFFLRPAPGWARYRTPIDNLYMCGSAAHPGGGIMGAPGRNAARAILGRS